ncbi:Hypothetical predicted protein [Pelobates cultripes]|uniref:PiggyBac transposable element-derived protein domain-containing protein n=1 Tax=Pelobates cultripes TaxID=61616 RepID=A0AAD1TJ94_PELCU|nr:Hypothetical predicted protein [Pelobates cultripes]
MATSSVLSLIEPLLNQGYCVTTDNFYPSTELYEFLLQNKTDAYGTVRANRLDMPPMFGNKKLKTGEMVAWQKGKMMALRWRGKKDVCLMIRNTSTVMVRTKGGKEVGVVNLECLTGRPLWTTSHQPRKSQHLQGCAWFVAQSEMTVGKKSESKPGSIVLIVTSDFVQSHVSKFVIPGMFTKPICSV